MVGIEDYLLPLILLQLIDLRAAFENATPRSKKPKSR
jgi:hypothetical protein